MKKTIVAILVLAALAIPLMADSCSGVNTQNSNDLQSQEQDQNAAHRAQLVKAQPYPQTSNSSELQNLRQYYLRTQDPKAVNYVYVITTAGQVIAEYQTIGKCTSTESVYSAPQSVVDGGSFSSSNQPVTVPAPQPDGSYGQNGNGLICFINNAAQSMFILYQGSNTLLWSQIPLGLTTAPLIEVVPNGK